MRKEEVLPSSRWKHFKGSIMEVIGTATNSETLEDMIIYKHNEELWVRPISSFLDDEDISKRKDNVTGQKYRFERID